MAKQLSDLDFNLTSKIINLSLPLLGHEAVNKDYVDNLISTAFKFQGVLDCSTNPNYPAAVIGDVYKVSVAGLVGGGSGIAVLVGDTIYCTAVNAGGTQAAVGASFAIIETNNTTATTTTAGNIALATQLEVDAETITDKAVTPSTLGVFIGNRSFSSTFGDGASSSWAIAHPLNTKDVICSVRNVTTDEVVNCDIQSNLVGSVSVVFSSPPALNSMRITITK